MGSIQHFQIHTITRPCLPTTLSTKVKLVIIINSPDTCYNLFEPFMNYRIQIVSVVTAELSRVSFV